MPPLWGLFLPQSLDIGSDCLPPLLGGGMGGQNAGAFSIAELFLDHLEESHQRLRVTPGGQHQFSGAAVGLPFSIARVGERQQAAEEIVRNDPFVQSMVRDFGARIVPGSIQPVQDASSI